MVQIKKKVIVLGSLAFDYIMGFEANICNAVSINKEKGEYQSTITANSRIQYFGGTAGNIAYNLGLLNIAHVSLVGAVGSDFDQLGYKKHIEQFEKIDIDVDIHEDLLTAACFIVNDIDANQMIIFHGGALDKCKDIILKEKIGDPADYVYAINSTLSVEAMTCFTDQLYNLKIPMIFDPGQVTPLFGKDLLIDILKKTQILIGNKFEIGQILQKTQMSKDDLIKLIHAIIETKGAEGSELTYRDTQGKVYHVEIPICKPEKKIVDTTGAGDGYRAGLLSGLILNMTLLDSCRLGSVIGSFVVESHGAQTHYFQIQDVKKRFFENYKYLPQELEFMT
jgi:adenosine kinase